MTVSYQYEVASSTSGGFTRLLFMWRGSLYKLIYRELLLFLVLFGVLSALYRHAFTAAQKKEFEQIVVYCDTLITLIPLSFVLGFYVSYVAQRWWNQYQAIPWPDKLMHLVALYIAGNDEYGRMLRRTLMRYLNLSLILVLRSISSAVKRRFPTLDHVVDSGFMTSLELDLFKSVPSLEFNTYWIPCTWFINLLKEARRSHRLPDAQGLKLIMEEFNDFRSKCGMLWSYDWVSIPLVYTQVVTLATYTFFGVALIGRQYIDGTQKQFQLKIDTYLPVFTILQFFFFMGLLKVAEQLINPFGDDDEDFELNWLIDRHTKVSYLGVDALMTRCPPLVKDIYFDAENLTLPYTEAAAAYKKKTYRGSVADMPVPEEKQTMFLPDIAEEEEEVKESQTPRTSTFSLTVSDSPMNSRRQISGSPQVRPKMAHSSPEAVLQVDAQQDSPIAESVPPEQKRHLVEAVKKFSALTRTPRIDPNRKPFFPLSIKTPKVTLQPWPSATNLSQSSSQEPGTPMPRASGMGFPPPCRSSLKLLSHAPPVISTSPPRDSLYDENLDEYDNSSNLSYEGYEDTPEICGCNDENNESPKSDVSNFRCCHMVFNPEGEIDASMLTVEPGRSNVQVNPKCLVRRQSSIDGSGKRRGVHWSPSFSGQSSVVRKKAEGAKSTEENIPCAMSSPNLTNLEADLELKRKRSFDVKLDPSDESKEVTKL